MHDQSKNKFDKSKSKEEKDKKYKGNMIQKMTKKYKIAIKLFLVYNKLNCQIETVYFIN